MKICVTSEDSSLESNIDSRFGRCNYFIIANCDNDLFEAVLNPYIEQKGGAGIKSAQFMQSKGVKVLLTGHLGVNAMQTLKALNIETHTGIIGTVKDALKNYKKIILNIS